MSERQQLALVMQMCASDKSAAAAGSGASGGGTGAAAAAPALLPRPAAVQAAVATLPLLVVPRARVRRPPQASPRVVEVVQVAALLAALPRVPADHRGTSVGRHRYTLQPSEATWR